MVEVTGNIIDIHHRRIFQGSILINNGKIQRLIESDTQETQFILPGFIDGHIHIESSMLIPSEFARLASVHGTVATVSDPHEIANVLGIKGVEFMLKNAATVPFKFYFGAPACVPATVFETAGAALGPKDIENLFKRDDILFLSEMMNVLGVLNDDFVEFQKLDLAKKYGKRVDGHSPELRGVLVEKYVKSGITTDHECVSLEEAREKIGYGMVVQIREGSAARNLDELMPLIDEYPDRIMLCSDDKHPDDLAAGHIDEMVRRSLAKGLDLFHVLQAACVNPVRHYGLDVGLLQEGDPADFIVIDSLEKMNVLETWVNGEKIAENGHTLITSPPVEKVNRFEVTPKTVADFSILAEPGMIRVIEVLEGQLITKSKLEKPNINNGLAMQDVDRDILKITVVNRYENKAPAVGFIRNFGLKSGAIASSVAHDSHNIVAVGATDNELTRAVNLIIQNRGGVCVVDQKEEHILPLPVAGIMTDADGYLVAEKYAELDRLAKKLGSGLQAPFMILSFMALLVIPELKLSDRGLFDGNSFQFTPLFAG